MNVEKKKNRFSEELQIFVFVFAFVTVRFGVDVCTVMLRTFGE